MGRFTEEEEASMKVMWETAGMSASQIACHFGKGATRNCIIGIVHRRGWTLHAKPTGRHYHSHLDNMTRPPSKAMEPYGPLNDFPAAGLCKHITGDPGITDWHCCGYPTGNRDTKDNQEGDSTKPYCLAHHNIVSITPAPYTRVSKASRAGNPAWRKQGAANADQQEAMREALG